MVLILGSPLRRFYNLGEYITARHLDNLAKLLLAAGLFVDYSYLSEVFGAFYGGDPHEVALTLQRFGGAYAWVYWSTIACNVVAIQALWSRRVRATPAALFVIAMLVLLGMWLERFMLIVSSLYRDFLPSSWGMFYPSLWDFVFLLGSIGLFFLFFLLFLRWLPMLSMYELRRQHAITRRSA
jgi:molybdopterin-containing oxidoreductase family membrane subunit